jgi:protein-S-isoprenylcysteine O-methyltransferase Ste14
MSALLIAALVIDLIFLRFIGIPPRSNPLFWSVEAFTILFCVLPAQCFARWTRQNRYLAARNILHVFFHSALILAIWPLLAVELSGGNWHAWAERASALNKIYLQLLCIPGVLLLTAMQEFHTRGRGTPMPKDAPRTLVTSGIYAYVANPMQIGKFGVLAGWGCFWKNPWIVAVAFLGLAYSLTIARWREDRDLAARFGAAWTNYRRHVPRWLPRWRPWIPAPVDMSQPPRAAIPQSAALYLDFDCGPCAHMARWFASQNPTGLQILPLSKFPGPPPTQMTYRPVVASAYQSEPGVAAIARALEHIHFAWAFCGWMLRLPVICGLAQLISDAVSPREPHGCPVPSSPMLSAPSESGGQS